MTNIFLISDTHFGHTNICKFVRDDSSPLRPWNDIDKMDADLVQKWNAKVSVDDLVYHLGDVVMNRKKLWILQNLKGRKRLVLGNHDRWDYDDYSKYFECVYGSTQLDGYWLTHIPIQADTIQPRGVANIHGHLHYKDISDPRYFNVSVEMINYEPIALDDLKIKLKEKQRQYS